MINFTLDCHCAKLYLLNSNNKQLIRKEKIALYLNSSKVVKITALFCLASGLIMSILITGWAAQQSEDQKVALAIVNDEVITLEEFNQYWDMIPENYKAQLNKEDVLEQIITQTLLLQKAEEINLREEPDVAFQIKNTVDQILIQSLLEKEIVDKTSLNEDDITSYYEENKEEYWQEEEVHALDILVETREQAEEVLQKLEEGQEFEAVARESSIASTAAAGGDIGFVSKGTLMPEIEEQLFTLNPGEFSEIISTDKGFHVFKVLEKNPSGYLELAEVKTEIENQLLPVRQQEAFDQYLKNAEDQATIEKNIALFQEQQEQMEDIQGEQAETGESEEQQ